MCANVRVSVKRSVCVCKWECECVNRRVGGCEWEGVNGEVGVCEWE